MTSEMFQMLLAARAGGLSAVPKDGGAVAWGSLDLRGMRHSDRHRVGNTALERGLIAFGERLEGQNGCRLRLTDAGRALLAREIA